MRVLDLGRFLKTDSLVVGAPLRTLRPKEACPMLVSQHGCYFWWFCRRRDGPPVYQAGLRFGGKLIALTTVL